MPVIDSYPYRDIRTNASTERQIRKGIMTRMHTMARASMGVMSSVLRQGPNIMSTYPK